MNFSITDRVALGSIGGTPIKGDNLGGNLEFDTNPAFVEYANISGSIDTQVYYITLHGVSFILLPRVSVYVSCISVVWATETNRTYQLQYALSLPADWADLGPPIQGTGTNVVFNDPVLAEPRRFYRVIPIE